MNDDVDNNIDFHGINPQERIEYLEGRLAEMSKALGFNAGRVKKVKVKKPVVKCMVGFPEDIYDRLENVAIDEGRPVGNMVKQIVIRYLKLMEES